MDWIQVERSLPEDAKLVLVSGECQNEKVVVVGSYYYGQWHFPYCLNDDEITATAWMYMPLPYVGDHCDPKGPPGLSGYLLHPWTGEKCYNYSTEKYMNLFDEGEKEMSYDFSFAQQGWMCPVCKRVYSPMTPMCYYCGGEQKTIATTSTSELWIESSKPERNEESQG